MIINLEYKNWINYNFNITELKDANAGRKLLNHMLNNKNRKTGQEFLNKKPELENIYEGLKPEKIIEKYLKVKDQLPKGGKGSKPFRFITSTLNVEPTEKNIKIIQDWYNKMKKMYEDIYGKENILAISLHLNETRPGIHICLKNWNEKNKKYGVYNEKVKVPMSGEKGRDLVNLIWNKGGKLVEGLAKQYKKEYRQEATTNLSKEIEQVRKVKKVITKEKVVEVPVVKEVIKKVEVEEIKEIQEAIFKPLQSEVMIKQTAQGAKRICWLYDPASGAIKGFQQSKDLYGNWNKKWDDLDWNYWRSSKQELMNWRDNFKAYIDESIFAIENPSEAIKDLQKKIKSR